jgi:DNA-binding MarR family transcriptional regulator
MKSSKLDHLRKRQLDSLGYLLIRCGQLWNERGIAAVNAEAGRPALREAHTRLLPYLQAAEGVRITDLAKRLDVTKQAVQPLVADLVGAGIARVEPDPDDARAKRLFLTPHGVEAVLHGTGILERIELELAPRLGRDEVRTLKAQLRRLLELLGP